MSAASRPDSTIPTPGLSGIALYLPPWRVDLRHWCEWTGTPPERVTSVVGSGFRLPGPHENVYTMAATAVLRLMQRYQVDPARVRYLALGTESSTDNSAGAIIVRGMLDDAFLARGEAALARQCEVPEFKQACLGGVYALKGALRFLATDGRDSVAIVVCADKALYELGSSGEPTQGAGAVALLLENSPRLARIDLREAGTASEYRAVDFRKPLLGRGGADCLDIPVYNGRYSTNCYVDQVRRALADMYGRRGLDPAPYLRQLSAVFMHRPYQRMPETGWGLAYLFALAASPHAEDAEELAAYCGGAGLELAAVREEMRASVSRAPGGCLRTGIQEELYPLSHAVLRAFRQSEAFSRHVLARMTLGTEWMQEMGNLYTGALPAWLAAGLADAAARSLPLGDQEVLLVGYGSGDAAEVMPLHLVPGWEQAAALIDIPAALTGAIDVDQAQYLALRKPGGTAPAIPPSSGDSFVIDSIGHTTGPGFQDVGIEYYRYVPGV